MKMKLAFSNLRMKTKLMLLYFPITLASLMIVGVLAYAISSNALKEQSLKLIKQAQTQVCTEISSSISRYESTLNSFCYDVNKNRTLKGNFYQIYDEKRNMESTISNIFSVLTAYKVPANITLVRANSSGSESIGRNFHQLIQSMPDRTAALDGVNIQIINQERIENRPWVQAVMSQRDDCIWLQIENDQQYGYYSIVKWSSGEMVNSYDGFYVLTLRIEDILPIDRHSESQQAYRHLVLDENGQLIYSDKADQLFYEETQDEIATFCSSTDDMTTIGEKVLLKNRIQENGWTVITLFSPNELSRQASTIGIVVLVSCICVGFVLFVASMFLAHTISQRINRICRHMQRFQSGNFNSKIKRVHQDELGYLDSSFNEMVERIDSLIQKVYQANIDIKEAQLHALQAQINPHFLYNSLSIINRLSDLGYTQEINRVVFALATFYRMTLSEGKDIISLEDELKHINAYLEIYKLRLEDRFEVVFDFDQQLMRCETVKVILQPFVENIFEHAMGNDEKIIHIRLSGKYMSNDDLVHEDYILLTIEDDGLGIEPEKISELLYTDSQNVSGYGIKNVHQRIQLYYGAEYGVQITSELGKGTTVYIRIPHRQPDSNIAIKPIVPR